MNATVTIKDLSDQFWNGFGELIPAFLSQSPIDQFQRLEKLSHEMPKNVSLKIGNGAFRDRMEWVREIASNPQNLTSKVEPRRGYKLVTFELDGKNPVKPRKGEKTKAFVSRCMSEEKEKFPKQKQRIAVCLSKSQARKNPYLESGADISKRGDINRKAASMA
jgi:hypothetical protein